MRREPVPRPAPAGCPDHRWLQIPPVPGLLGICTLWGGLCEPLRPAGGRLRPGGGGGSGPGRAGTHRTPLPAGKGAGGGLSPGPLSGWEGAGPDLPDVPPGFHRRKAGGSGGGGGSVGDVWKHRRQHHRPPPACGVRRGYPFSLPGLWGECRGTGDQPGGTGGGPGAGRFHLGPSGSVAVGPKVGGSSPATWR